MELFHFDIECAGEHRDYDEFKKADERGARLFEGKWKRMGWDQKHVLADSYLDQSGIIPTYGRICCISFGYSGQEGEPLIRSFCGEDERDIVSSFNDLLKKIERKSFRLAGFRINHYDVPWVLHKLHKYGVEPAGIIRPYDKKPWEMRIVDMAEDWKQKFAYSFSFDEMAYELGIKSPKEAMDGSMVHQYYHQGRIDDIRRYCEADVETCILAAKMIYGK